MAIIKGRIKHSKAMANWKEVHYAMLNRRHTHPPGFGTGQRRRDIMSRAHSKCCAALQRQKRLEKKLADKLQKAAAIVEKKNQDWRLMVDKIKSEVRFDENDSRSYNYNDYLPRGAREEKEQLLKQWRDEVKRGLTAEVYEGFANISLDQDYINSVFGVQPT